MQWNQKRRNDGAWFSWKVSISQSQCEVLFSIQNLNPVDWLDVNTSFFFLSPSSSLLRSLLLFQIRLVRCICSPPPDSFCYCKSTNNSSVNLDHLLFSLQSNPLTSSTPIVAHIPIHFATLFIFYLSSAWQCLSKSFHLFLPLLQLFSFFFFLDLLKAFSLVWYAFF